MPARRTDGRAASQRTDNPKTMKNAPIEYSKALVVPDVSASQPASGTRGDAGESGQDGVGAHREAQQ